MIQLFSRKKARPGLLIALVATVLLTCFGRADQKSEPAFHLDLRYLDNGFFVLTNKNMYFAGQRTTFRVPYNSILRFKAYPDGLGFFRSIGAGREEIFTVVNPNLTPLSGLRYFPKNAVTLHVGWFLYNLVTFLTTRE
jgi:hypothetical protein